MDDFATVVRKLRKEALAMERRLEYDIVLDGLEFDRALLQHLKGGEIDRDGAREAMREYMSSRTHMISEHDAREAADQFISLLDEMGIDGLIDANARTREAYSRLLN